MPVPVPSLVRATFDRFPLKVLEPTGYNDTTVEEKPRAVNEPSTVVYVFNVDSDGLCTEPRCLAMQTWAALVDSKSRVKIEPASTNVSPTGTLPFVVDYGKSKGTVSVDDLKGFASPGGKSADAEVFSLMIANHLGDAWLAAMLDPNHQTAKDSVYILEHDRQELPSFAVANLSLQVSEMLFGGLKARFPRMSASTSVLRTYTAGYTIPAAVNEQIAQRAKDCVAALDSMLEESQGPFLGIGTDSTNVNRVDVLLFSYVHAISTVLGDSELAQLLTPRLKQHADAVLRASKVV